MCIHTIEKNKRLYKTNKRIKANINIFKSVYATVHDVLMPCCFSLNNTIRKCITRHIIQALSSP